MLYQTKPIIWPKSSQTHKILPIFSLFLHVHKHYSWLPDFQSQHSKFLNPLLSLAIIVATQNYSFIIINVFFSIIITQTYYHPSFTLYHDPCSSSSMSTNLNFSIPTFKFQGKIYILTHISISQTLTFVGLPPPLIQLVYAQIAPRA